LDKAILVGFLDLYRTPKYQRDGDGNDVDDVEEPLEPLPPLSWSELWPPSPRVRILLIGAGFFLLNFILLGIFAIVWVTNN
jgi:hypothetical protein